MGEAGEPFRGRVAVATEFGFRLDPSGQPSKDTATRTRSRSRLPILVFGGLRGHDPLMVLGVGARGDRRHLDAPLCVSRGTCVKAGCEPVATRSRSSSRSSSRPRRGGMGCDKDRPMRHWNIGFLTPSRKPGRLPPGRPDGSPPMKARSESHEPGDSLCGTQDGGSSRTRQAFRRPWQAPSGGAARRLLGAHRQQRTERAASQIGAERRVPREPGEDRHLDLACDLSLHGLHAEPETTSPLISPCRADGAGRVQRPRPAPHDHSFAS